MDIVEGLKLTAFIVAFLLLAWIAWVIWHRTSEPRRRVADRRRCATQAQKRIIFERYHGRCAHCGRLCVRTSDPVGNQANVDHIVPYSWGGTTTLDNLQLLCRFCNEEKSNHYSG